jgi:3-deoxy-manno-octulosonate cytidylyltransferase (CMP-KDO synthetase)
MYSDTTVIIPSRLGSKRLPEKSLAKIGNMTMIEHVITKIKESNIQNIYVATDSKQIADLATSRGAIAIMTDANCPSGTDRVYEAFQKLENKDKINYVINVQGDMPFIDTGVIVNIINTLKKGVFDIVTSVVNVDKNIAMSNASVKVVIDKNNKAMYFSREPIPHNSQNYLYHVGIYGFTKNALSRFVTLEQSDYEKSENLEQLRALENGLSIGVCYSDQVPISVDTKEDLEEARNWYNKITFKKN